LLDAGMNVARMNFSHGHYADHEAIHQRPRAAAQSADKVLAILADLQGPKIRLEPVRGRAARVAHRRAGHHHRHPGCRCLRGR
jgi:pyruvate kinase